MAQTMYTHVSKCKNNKIKGIKKKIHSLVFGVSGPTIHIWTEGTPWV
jgi:hypothetical protein